jgi:glycosyltransferase involved in cell wall biosynthesis
MNVLFIPTSKGNPYQTELARCLHDYNVDVILKDEALKLPILRVILSTGRPDILHLHWTHTLIKSRNTIERLIKGFRFLGEIILLKISGVKIIWTVHNVSDHDLKENRIENLIHRYFSKLCDAIILHCEYAIEAAKYSYKHLGTSKTKIFVIQIGNYIKSYKNDISRKKARKLLGFKDREIVFGFFGTIRKYKGVLDLVQAFQKLKEPRIRLLLAGKPWNNNIKMKLESIAKIDKRISLSLGFIPEDKIQIYLKSMDVVVLPFKKILTSASTLLAMSYGKPVVAPAIGCLKETLGNNGNLLYEPEGVNSLVHALKKSLKADLHKLGKRNLKLALKSDWRFIAKKTASVYNTILDS